MSARLKKKKKVDVCETRDILYFLFLFEKHKKLKIIYLCEEDPKRNRSRLILWKNVLYFLLLFKEDKKLE
jgi:hypothetical protein